MKPVSRWGLMWLSRNLLDGETTHIVMDDCLPVLFRTRRDARAYANEHWGYIKTRRDLRQEPFGWRMPLPIRLSVAPASGGAA